MHSYYSSDKYETNQLLKPSKGTNEPMNSLNYRYIPVHVVISDELIPDHFLSCL